MPIDLLILVVTAVLAVVALIAAVISVRNLKEIRTSIAEVSSANQRAESKQATQASDVLLPQSAHEQTSARSGEIVYTPSHSGASNQELVPHHGQAARVVEGKVIVTPTRAQVAHAIMGQPRVRFAIWMTGVAHALRPESRDRIIGMMRRDYRERRRHREQAARAAARTAHSPATNADERTGR